MSVDKELEKRVADILEAYDQQGVHRTGTDVDTESAHWLADQIEAVGQEAMLTGFRHLRVDPILSELQIGDDKIGGMPFYDGTFTDEKGVVGRLGGFEDDIPIAVGHHFTNRTWDEPELIEARRAGKYKAMIAICKRSRSGDVAGLTPTNAEDFTSPFGPPVLQVADDAEDRIMEAISSGEKVRLIAQVERTEVEVFNVEVRIKGKDSTLSPLVVITPRSGWCHCVSERGGGIACWLEMIRVLSKNQPERDVWFVASTGHELEHLGLKFFLEHHRALIKEAHAWIHLGASFAAANRPSIRLQTSDAKLKQLVFQAIENLNIPSVALTPIGSRPGGEARNIFDGNGRYISLLGGGNRLFHHSDDRWPDAVDLEKVVGLVGAFTKLAGRLAHAS